MSSTKKVLAISSSYPQSSKDWKSIFIRQLINALADNFQLKLSYWGPNGPLPKNVSYVCLPQEEAWLSKLMEQGGIAHLFRQGGLNAFLAPVRLLLYLRKTYKRHKNIDLYHINWLENALPLWGTKQPAVISVLGSDFGLLKIPGMIFLLRQVFKQRPCILAPNADWMVSTLKKCFGDVADIVTIPLGIDEEWYDFERAYLPSKPNKWLVITRITAGKIGFLFDWGGRIFQDGHDHELHLFGPMQEDMTIPSWVHYHGSTHPAELREHWFPQATGLVTLSQHDEGRPQVMLEAMASGLPILASRLPAHEDFIEHLQTGWLASSEKTFQDGIEWLSKPENNRAIASGARAWVLREVGTWEDCARRYINSYNKLLGDC